MMRSAVSRSTVSWGTVSWGTVGRGTVGEGADGQGAMSPVSQDASGPNRSRVSRARPAAPRRRATTLASIPASRSIISTAIASLTSLPLSTPIPWASKVSRARSRSSNSSADRYTVIF